MIRTFRTLTPLVALLATPAAAGDFDTQMSDFLDANVRSWAADPVIVKAVTAQNAETAGYDQARIDELDTTWRAQVGSADTSLIDPVITGPVADFLRGQMDAMGGQVTEIILMDARGLNVATSAVTSDYWQGDEEKHSMTYAVGPDGVHFGDIEFDESTQTYQAQISFTITDPASGAPIGAMTVAVDGDAFL
ncbi:hypothetical protein SAMN05444722_0220 [Rhodovulum sp. ES.010]|uniref:hypothetical protein n=1 Tax=Rhodovulum sp. ES.010 TaxID=1882821 RepID=UPI0009284D6D|nr:hypothetical protein [Rhodovulum sp. ES.010]SIO04504.1 hypothetical protein SAMN05444722_0220 [Rhodovulum sp. ES.010]